MRHKFIGPPGTGKTTRLLDIVEQELKTTDPTRVAFVSFTKKAVDEATDRACDRFNFTKKDLPYSAAYRDDIKLCKRHPSGKVKGKLPDAFIPGIHDQFHPLEHGVFHPAQDMALEARAFKAFIPGSVIRFACEHFETLKEIFGIRPDLNQIQNIIIIFLIDARSE